MARLKEKDYTYFTTVRGMCRQCRNIVPARVFFRDEQVWQQSLCPNCENEPGLIAADKNWYLKNVIKPMPDRAPLIGARPSKSGCPHDCGPCVWHAARCQLPVISITNACNLRCPNCFTYNRADKIYYMTAEEMQKGVDWIVEATGTVDLIDITGGEPTLHPQLIELLGICRRDEIGRIAINSNGIRLAEDESLCVQLAELGAYVILSFNTFDREASRRIHGQDLTEIKLKAIDNLTRAGVKVTLLNVMIHGVNEDAIAGIFDLMHQNDNIISLTVQTMAFTGQGGGQFARSRHIPVDEATRIVCEQSRGMLKFEDFISKPPAHPLCYLICYILKSDQEFLPFTRFTSDENLLRLLRDSYLIRPGSSETLFTDAINQMYAEGKNEYLSALRGLVEKLYPSGSVLTDFQRQQVAESAV
ncbi:MAG: radical SAM protein, partial [Planctomycetes bacterium]|nr:radical SAM protein [Planctomycetota bacterium]